VEFEIAQVPKGRLKKHMLSETINRPFGAWQVSRFVPGGETPGYYQMSLRDELNLVHDSEI
jgi:hypothetical protein